MQNKCMDFLMQKYGQLFENLSLVRSGYNFTSLRRVIPADVLTAVVTETVSNSELAWLKLHKKNICVIAVDKAWKKLKKESILPEFIIGNQIDAADESLKDIAVIANINEDAKHLKAYQGQIFFYWTEENILSKLCKEAQQKSQPDYVFNVIEPVPAGMDCCAWAKYAAGYMKGEYAIQQGEQILLLDGTDDFYKIDRKENRRVECHVREMYWELPPLIDDAGRNFFDRKIQDLRQDAEKIIGVLKQGKQLYQQLGLIAKKEVVFQEELQEIVAQLNRNLAQMEQDELYAYAQVYMNEWNMAAVEKRDTQNPSENEIAQIAETGLYESDLLLQIYTFFAHKLFLEKPENTDKRNICREIAKKQRRILIVYGESQYQVIGGFVRELKDSFQGMGIEVHIWDGSYGKTTYGYNIYQCLTGYDYILMFNGVGIEGVIGADIGNIRFWYENKNTRAAAVFLDHPLMHKKRIEYISENADVIYGDKYDWKFIKNYMPWVKNVHYALMGGRVQEKIRFEEKENKIVFFGGRQDLKKIAEEIEQSVFKRTIWELIGKLLQTPSYTVEDTIEQTGSEKGCGYGLKKLFLSPDIFLLIQRYVRAYFREKVLLQIAESGLPMDIYGWHSEEMTQYPNVVQKEAVGYEEMMDICRHTRFVLNVQPWAKDGPQERVFNAMLGGSIAVTDVADSLECEYADGQNIIFYHLNDIETLPRQIRYYMEHEKDAAELAEKGYRITTERHTTDHYAAALLQILESERQEDEKCRS